MKSLLTLLLPALLGATGACAPTDEAAERPAFEAGDPDETVLRRIRTIPAREATERVVVHLPAEVVLPTHAIRRWSPPLEGRVVSWSAREGAVVTAGTELARMASPSLSEAAAELAAARQVLEEREAWLATVQEQVVLGWADRGREREAEASVAEAAGALRVARERNASRRGRTADADRDGQWSWRAPTDAVVQRSRCAEGQWVGLDGEACLDVVDPAAAVLRVQVPESYLHALPAQAEGEFHPHDGSPPLAVRETRRDTWLRPATRSLALDLLPASPRDPLRAGGTGRLALHAPPARGTLLVPELSLTRIEGRDVIFVRVSDDPAIDSFAPVPVERVGRHDGDVLVRAEPGAEGVRLQVGTEVVTRGLWSLRSVWLLRLEDGDGADEESP